jgi:microsomal dipeptidase-like Zn-dependent dipeptidase
MNDSSPSFCRFLTYVIARSFWARQRFHEILPQMKPPSRSHGFKALFTALLALLLPLGAGAAPFAGDRATLELHSHLFMKEGMGWAATGDFDGPLRAKDWKALFASQANPEALDRSEIGLIVATLYAHPLFTWSLRDSIRRQIAQAEAFVAAHPHWVIARDAVAARAALSAGKRVIVLALEGAAGVIEEESDLREFVDERGVRIVTLLHLTDDRFGGVAFLRGLKAIASPWAWITQALSPARDSGGVRINANGLASDGRAMTEALLKRGVWIDLAHASDRSQAAITPILRARGQPLLYTHTPLRKYLGAERGISAEQLALVKESGGIVGAMPSEDMLEGTQVPPHLCTGGDSASTQSSSCNGVSELAVQYQELVQTLSPEQVALGSDTNGGLRHLRPSGPPGTEIAQQGYWNIGQQAALWDALEQLKAPIPNPRRKMIDRFLDAWERVHSPAKASPSSATTNPKGTASP